MGEGSARLARPEQAGTLAELWEKAPSGDILELGFAYGKGSAYLGALASSKRAHVFCIDNDTASARDPLASDTVRRAGVANDVTLIQEPTGYNWWLMRQLEQSQEPHSPSSMSTALLSGRPCPRVPPRQPARRAGRLRGVR